MTFNDRDFFKIKDMYNIYNLITKINSGYRLYFCNKDKMFYVINIYKNNEICSKYYNISANIITDLRFSQSKNINNIIKSIEENNEKITTKNDYNFKQKIHDELSEIYHYSLRSNTLTKNEINKIIGA